MELRIFRSIAGQQITYREMDRLQRMRAHSIATEGAPGFALLFECAPTVTLGRRLQDPELRKAHLLWSQEEFARQGVAVQQIQRGGFATYHGPGQWVLFLVDRLDRLTGDRRGVRKAVTGLLDGTREFAQSLLPHEEVMTCIGGELGVWSPRGKLAALGIEIEAGVLLHGMALNFYRAGEAFPGIRPCGLDTPPADLLAQAPSSEEFERLGMAWARGIAKQFDLSLKTPTS